MRQNKQNLMTLSCLSEKRLETCTTSSVKFINTKEMTFKAFWKAKLVTFSSVFSSTYRLFAFRASSKQYCAENVVP
jgi:hypothetical protein